MGKSQRSIQYERHRDKERRQQAEYYIKNREKLKAATARYQLINADVVRRKNSERWAKNAVRNSRKKAAHYAKNSEAIRAKVKLYREANPDKIRILKARRRASKRNAIIGNPKVIKKWELAVRKKPKTRCYWCKTMVSTKRIHVDHILALIRGGKHEVGNLCIACESCNLKKNRKTVKEWNEMLSEPVLL